MSQQYSFRAQKSLGLVGGSPDYQLVQGFVGPDVPAKQYQYSTDGRLYAYAVPTCVRIYMAEGAQLLAELPLPNIVEVKFSPRGTYLSTWERPQKLEDGQQHKNLRVFSVSTGEELISFSQKYLEDRAWDLQYTISESRAIRLVGQEIQVYDPSDWSKSIVDKLRVEGATAVTLSPGLNPSIAVFVAEKKGAPASIKIYSLSSLAGPPACQKTFYKADRSQVKWNVLGTQVLLLTQTEVDNTNKSYYGETGLYLLSAAGNFDCRVTLDKEGPIHDFAWSPNSKEFGVVYGCESEKPKEETSLTSSLDMPAKTVLFDQRVNTIQDFGSAPHNFISFNPQGRLIILAGFGNLAGKMDIIDRRGFQKLCTIDAPNTSHCEWSPDGRYILTATLSPRLRVDNGVKVWHCTGPLMHVQLTEELYQASWRPLPLENAPGFGQVVIAAPQPSASVLLLNQTAKPASAKPAGAYRPPGARGLATPNIFKREDEGGEARRPTNGTSTPPRTNSYSGRPSNGGHVPGSGPAHNNGRRYVPGAPPPGSVPHDDRDRKAKNKKGKKRDPREEGGYDQNVPTVVVEAAPEPAVITEDAPPIPQTPGAEGLDPVAKKIRNLTKKLKAIEELKEKQKRGDRLEATQLKKIAGEAELRQELGAAEAG